MMTQSRSTEKRRTIAAFSSYVATRQRGLYTHMFVEDISVGLMGFRQSAEDDGRRVEVEGDEPGKAALKAICTSLSDSYYSRYDMADIADIVQSAIESIGRRLAWYGKAVYEICGAGVDTSLASIVPYHLLRVPGGFIQLVPKEERQLRETRRYVFLPSGSAWVVQVPHELGGAKAHQRVLAQLNEVSQPAPKFWTRELEAGNIATEFRASDYNRTRGAYIARITRQWGWNRRDSSGTYDTEFFYFFRSLRFRKAQAMFRDHIVGELNRFLSLHGINACIRLKGFHSPAEIDNLINRASAGLLHYAEAWRQAV